MTEVCTVKKVKRDIAYVEIKRTEKCAGCNCCAFNNKNALVVPAKCDKKVSPGQSVIVEMPTRDVGAVNLLIYAIPLALILVGALIGLVGEWWLQLTLAAAGLVLGLLCAWLIDGAYRKKQGVLPVVIALATDGEPDQTDTTEK